MATVAEIVERISSLKQEVADLVGVGYPVVSEILDEIEVLEAELESEIFHIPVS